MIALRIAFALLILGLWFGLALEEPMPALVLLGAGGAWTGAVLYWEWEGEA